MGITVLSVLLALSLAGNGFLLFLLRKKSKKTQSYEVKHLLQDLLAGQAIVSVQRVAPVDVFIRSPRG